MKRSFTSMIALAGVVLTLGIGPASAVAINATIYDIQQGIVIAINDPVLVDSVVVIGVDVRQGTFGVYIQEPAGGAYSGIFVYRGVAFPRYTNSADPVAIGDLITVDGVVTDFAGLTEITKSPTPPLTKLGTVAPLAPEVLPIQALTTANPASEEWEGVLVRVENVVVTSIEAPFNNWRFHQIQNGVLTLDSLICYEKMFSNQIVPSVGDTLLSVTGVHDWAFNERRIAPRTNDDIVFLSPRPAPVPNLAYSTAENKIKVRFNVPLLASTAENRNHYSLSNLVFINSAVYDNPSQSVTLTTAANLVPSTTPLTLSTNNIRNADDRLMDGPQAIEFIGGIASIPFIQDPVSASNDTSKINGQQVSLRGVVTASGDDVDFPLTLGGFYVQDRSATEYAGVFVFGVLGVPPVRNDSVFVSGIVTEFGVGPETAITSIDEVSILASGVPPVAPVPVTLAQASGSDPVEAEKYESTLVQVYDVRVIASTSSPGEPFDVEQTTMLKSGASNRIAATDTLRVDDLALDEGTYHATVGDRLNVTGILRFSGLEPFRRLQPRNWNVPPVGDIMYVLFADAPSGPLGDPGLGQGVAWADYDSDGDLDLYLASSPGKLFRNDLQGGFVATYTFFGDGRGVAWGDYDSDGDPDLYLTNYVQNNRLFRNDGFDEIGLNWIWTEVAVEGGDPGNSTGAAWADYDQDGDLDLYVANDGQANRLYRRDYEEYSGQYFFTDVASGTPLADTGHSQGVAWADYDKDGDLDLYVANDGEANKLFRKDAGGFVDVAVATPLADAGPSRGVAWADYDNDLDLDLYVTNYGQPNKLFRNDLVSGNRVFTDVASGTPLADPGNGTGATWGDYDNDGDLDLYVANFGSTNKLFRNEGIESGIHRGFSDATAPSGLGDMGNGTGVAWADYDNDGYLDLYLANSGSPSRLFRNRGEPFSPFAAREPLHSAATGNSWLRVDLVGLMSNPTGIGARVRVVAGGISQIREISGGSGYLSQEPLEVMFGLGAAAVVESLEVRWPSGIVDQIPNVLPDRHVKVTEGTGTATDVKETPITISTLELSGGAPNPIRRATSIDYALPSTAKVRLVLYDVRGRLVRTLVDERQHAGRHRISWAGSELPSGLYFLRLEAAGNVRCQKIVLAR